MNFIGHGCCGHSGCERDGVLYRGIMEDFEITWCGPWTGCWGRNKICLKQRGRGQKFQAGGIYQGKGQKWEEASNWVCRNSVYKTATISLSEADFLIEHTVGWGREREGGGENKKAQESKQRMRLEWWARVRAWRDKYPGSFLRSGSCLLGNIMDRSHLWKNGVSVFQKKTVVIHTRMVEIRTK